MTTIKPGSFIEVDHMGGINQLLGLGQLQSITQSEYERMMRSMQNQAIGLSGDVTIGHGNSIVFPEPIKPKPNRKLLLIGE